MDQFKDMFASLPPSFDELLEDPTVRGRIGEWISMAMSRATRRRRRSSSPERPGVGPGPRFRG